MIPSSSDLAYFIEIAQTGNLSRAAERLGMSQPSLSLAMRRLEVSIGLDLLIRSKRGVRLTRAGEQLLAHSRTLMQNWESVRKRALASVKDVQGRFKLGCHVSVAQYTLPHFLPSLLAKYPGLEIQLVHDLSRKVAESVIALNLDLGIVVNPVRHSDLVISKLGEDEISLWRVSADQCANPEVLICDPDLHQTQYLLKELRRKGVTFQRMITSSSLEVVSRLAAAGAGVGMLPARVASERPELRRIAHAPVYRDEICLLYRVENRTVQSMQVITGAIVEGFKAKVRN